MQKMGWCHHLSLFTVLCRIVTGKISYEGFHLINVTVEEEEKVDALNILRLSSRAQFWTEPVVNRSIDILLSPGSKDDFLHELEYLNISYGTKSENIQSAIDDEQTPVEQMSNIATPYQKISYKYLTLNEILEYLNSLSRDHSDLVSLENIGSTYAGRNLMVVKIGKAATGGKKPAIWIDSGIHAREWISPATVLYIINKLVTSYDEDQKISPYIDQIDWYFLPVMNPDGYEHTHSEDRMWRKNRRPCTYFAWFKCCLGVDLNRNFGYKWGGPGASADPCDETYRGPRPFSEPESVAVRNYVTSKGIAFKAFLSIHSYGQLWMYPYGDRRYSYPRDRSELERVASEATRALSSMYNTKYTIGSPADLLYESSGASGDWAKGSAKIDYVYTLELRPSGYNAGDNGFILSPRAIVPTGEETWASIAVVADAVRDKYISKVNQ